jgi:uncharacterized membrane protein YfcA
MQTVAGTTFAAMILITASSAITHAVHGHVVTSLWLRILPSSLIGTFLGATCAVHMKSILLQKLFAGLLFLLALHFWFWRQQEEETTVIIPSLHLMIGGLAIGTVAGLFGLAGGALLVPFLSYHKVPLTRAIGTAAACTFPASVVGTLTFLWHEKMSATPALYINWQAALCIAVTALIFVQIGVRLAIWLQPQRLRQIFVIFLILTSLKIAF